MSSYVTLSMLLDRFGAEELVQLTNDRTRAKVTARMLTMYAAADPSDPVSALTAADQEALAVVAGVLQAAIEDGQAVADSYLEARFALPITADVPRTLINVTADLIRYQLYKLPTREVRQRYEDAVAWLRDLAAGRVAVGLSTADVQTPPLSGRIKVIQSDDEQASGRIFTRETLANYIDPT